MSVTRLSRKIWIVATSFGLLVAAMLVAAMATNAGPFRDAEAIIADDVCPAMGAGKKSAAALRKILPEASTYTFSGRDPRRLKDDYRYGSSCFVRGNDETLLSMRADMVFSGGADAWLEKTVGGTGKKGEDDHGVVFAKGLAVATYARAALQIPCLADGVIPKGSRSVRVVVRLDAEGAAYDPASRQALAGIALRAARHAHDRAGCDLPSRLPRKAPDLVSAGEAA